LMFCSNLQQMHLSANGTQRSDVLIDPIQVTGHSSVDARSPGTGASGAPRDHTVQRESVLAFQHVRTARISLAGVFFALIVSGAQFGIRIGVRVHGLALLRADRGDHDLVQGCGTGAAFLQTAPSSHKAVCSIRRNFISCW